MPVLWLSYVAIRLDSSKAEGTEFVLNLITPDNGENYVVELSNATLTSIEGFEAENPNLTISIDRSDLNQVMLGKETLIDMTETGVSGTEGDKQVIYQLRDMLVQFELGFEILPGTASMMMEPERNPFQQAPTALRGSE